MTLSQCVYIQQYSKNIRFGFILQKKYRKGDTIL